MPVRRLLPIALVASLLTSCATDSQTPEQSSAAPDTSTEAAATSTSVAETSGLVLGEFDPEGEFTVFDPCTEIPAEVLAEAGLGKPVQETRYDGALSVRCPFVATDPELSGFYTLTGDKVPRERIIERGLLLSEDAQSNIPGVYLHHMGSPVPDECSAAVHTNRGRFVVHYAETLTTRSREELCALAVANLEALFNHMGENNGNAHRS